MTSRLVRFIVIATLIFLPAFAQAAVGLQTAPDKLTPINRGVGAETDIGNITGTVIRAALTLVGLVFLLLMVYSGFLWMEARGDETKIEKAKEIVKSSLIGLVIVVSAYAITVFITKKLGG